jgi:aryl-alcohol dehydrogenase-like predicted oxidoreductase
MEKRILGRQGPAVSALGLGAWPLGGGMGPMDDATAASVVHAAIDSGVTLVDTAQYYFASEKRIGKALGNGYRARCFLATKVSLDYSRRGIRSAMENSLRDLQVDFVDLYQVHTWDPRYNLEETMETMERLCAEGKTRYIGVSNYNREQMRRALETARFHSSQPIYNLFDRRIEAEDLPFCEREGIGVLAHSPLAKGLLGGRYGLGHKFPASDERSDSSWFRGEAFAKRLSAAERLKTLARDKGITLAQLAIAWPLRKPSVTCVLFGAKSAAQVEENRKAAQVNFSDEELARIEEILKTAL